MPLTMKVNIGFLAGTLVMVTATGFTQVESGRIVGTINDQNKAVIPAAAIAATDASTNSVMTAISDNQGDYVVTPVNPGVSSVLVSAPGFQKMVRNSVEIQVGQIVREDFTMQVGSSTATVEVTGAPPLLNADTATIRQVVTNTQIVNLPLNGRGFYQLAQLTPGAALLPPTGEFGPNSTRTYKW